MLVHKGHVCLGMCGACDHKKGLHWSWKSWHSCYAQAAVRASEEGLGKIKARTHCAGINTCLQKPGGSTTICSSWFTLVLWPQFLTVVGASLHCGLTWEPYRQLHTRPAEQRGAEWKSCLKMKQWSWGGTLNYHPLILGCKSISNLAILWNDTFNWGQLDPCLGSQAAFLP